MKASFVVSIPTGIFAMFFVFILPSWLAGESLATMLIVETYGMAIVGMTISFLAGIWFATRYATHALSEDKSVLAASFGFSFIINFIMWLTFITLTAIDNWNDHLLWALIFPSVVFTLSLIGTTFTIGLLMCYHFLKNIEEMRFQ